MASEIRFNKKVLLFVLLRVAISLLLLGGFIAATMVFKQFDVIGDTYWVPVRDAYLALSMIFLVASAILAILLMFNFVNVGALANLPWFLIMIVLDSLTLVGMAVVSVFCAMREDDVQKISNLFGIFIDFTNSVFNKGAFGAAAGLGFASAIVCVVDIFFAYRFIAKSGVKAQVPY